MEPNGTMYSIKDTNDPEGGGDWGTPTIEDPKATKPAFNPPTSETPFKWYFAGGRMVARFFFVVNWVYIGKLLRNGPGEG